jgi:membrane protein required for colicin V production
MELIDIVLSVVLILGVFKGYRNGFFVELASLISIMLGIYLAIRFSFITKSYLEKEVAWNPKAIEVAAFAITFLIVIIVVSSLAKAFTSMANFASLGFVNNLLGAFLGLLRTVLVVSILLNLLQKVNFENCFLSKETKEKSTLYPLVQEVSKNIYPSISDWFEVFQTNEFSLENDRKKD